MPQATQFVDIGALAHLPHVHVAARAVVDGMRSGIHRSQRKGQSVDFADHRPYVPGDDTRHVDWKILGRSDRLVIRRYEAESDLCAWFFIDASASMGFQGSDSAVSKYRYAAILAATLGYLLIDQHDTIGWSLCQDQAPAMVPGGATLQHFHGFCGQLDNCTPLGEQSMASLVDQMARLQLRRGLVVICSDLLDDPSEWGPVLDRLRHHGHEPAMLWVLDVEERHFPLQQMTQFEALEGMAVETLDPRTVQKNYQACVRQHEQALRRVCQKRGVPLIDCVSSDSPQAVLHKFLVALQQGSPL